MDRLPNLDPLRFILASLVTFYHLPAGTKAQGLPTLPTLSIFDKGTEAVYMFFVLSGFLIIRIIYQRKLQDRFSIKNFYMRRILRIFPLYYLIVIFGLTFYNVVLPMLGMPFEIRYNWYEAFFYLVFFLANVFSHLFRPGAILEVLWSIGIEEQFYLMIAPLLFFIAKGRILKVLIALSAGYFVIFHLEFVTFLRRFDMLYFYLFFGGIVAIMEEKKQLEFLKSSVFIPMGIVTVIVLYFFTDIFRFEILWLYNLFTMVFFGLFIHTIAHNNYGVEVRNRKLNYLGQISYGIYMYHIIAMDVVIFIFLKIQQMKIFSDLVMVLLINILTFVLTIIISHVSYKYFETYFLKLKIKFR